MKALTASVTIAAVLVAAACGSASTASPAATRGTAIVAKSSEFGQMLFNSKRQAIYIFQRDTRNRSNCYGECARLWPPVYTKAKPRASGAVRVIW